MAEKNKVILELDQEEAEALRLNALHDSVKRKVADALRPLHEAQYACIHCGHQGKFHHDKAGCAVMIKVALFDSFEGGHEEMHCGCPKFHPVRQDLNP